MKDYKDVAQSVFARSEKMQEKQKRERAALLRWGSLAVCLVLIVSLSFGLLGGKPAEPQKQIVLPPCREGTSKANASLLRGYTFEEAVDESVAVAWIRIGNWLSEDLEAHPMGVTFFEAEVIECYKGDLPESIEIFQFGSSKATMQGFELFTYGDELLVFLNQAGGEEPYGERYYLTGNYATLMNIVKDTDGVAYASASFTPLVDTLPVNMNNSARNTQLKETLSTAAAVYDTYLASHIRKTEYLFNLSEIVELIDS